MEKKFDLIVIGTGAGGSTVAHKCRKEGWDVAIIDSRPFGGTCALRGCDPKKVLVGAADLIDWTRRMEGKGISSKSTEIAWQELMRFKRTFTEPVPENREKGYAKAGIIAYHGRTSFINQTTVRVGDNTLTARFVHIAAGAKPAALGIPGEEHLTTSDQFLEMEQLPKRIIFVGGGYIAFEFAHIAARAGSSPVIVDRGERPLKNFDPDLVDLLVERGREVGIDLRRTTTIVEVQPSEGGYQVTLEQAGAQETIHTDLVVHGAGRVAELADLGLDAAGVEWGEHGMQVADHLQSTTNPAVWAAGDSADTEGMPLTPIAVSEAKVAASNMLKDTTSTPDYAGIPTAVFTIPELARVGLLESEARAAGIDLAVRYSDTSGWYSNYRIGETTAAAKILIDKSNDQIVGAHLLGPEYGELINTLGLAIKLGLTTRQLKSATAAYPTVGSDLGSML